jgi:hypothetical protein
MVACNRDCIACKKVLNPTKAREITGIEKAI